MKAWSGKSLWIPNPPFMGGCTCFEFHAWSDCKIFSLDENMAMAGKNGRACEIKEYMVTDSPGMQQGDYGMIVMGVGTSVNYGFPRVLVPSDTAFAPRNSERTWEISDAPCSARAR